MQSHSFKSHDDYIETQIRLTRKKIDIGYANHCFTSEKVTNAIHKYHKAEVKYGMCHGVRKGSELDMFDEKFSGEWIGTEITPEICDGERILHRDFNKVDNNWIGNFDVIHSNSFDHSNNPWITIKAWLACLSETGRLYVEWTRWHDKLGKGGINRADCFAASSEEYRDIFEKAGKVEDVLLIPDRGRKKNKFTRHIFVIH